MAWHDQPKHRDHPDVDAYIADQSEPQRAILDAVRRFIKQDPDIVEGIAWGVPCYFRNGPFCYTSAAKTHVTLGWFRGIEINDPTGRLTGTGKSPVAKTTIKVGEGLPDGIDAWFEQALRLDEEGE